MWLKFVLALAIVAFCTAFGYFAANKYRARKKFYAQLAAFNERYLNELGYQRRPLSAFLKEYEYTGDFDKVLKRFSDRRETAVSCAYLTKEERDACADYFSMLGKGDALSQKGFFGSKRTEIEKKRAESEQEAAKKGALYLKLGILAGLAVVILIV